MDQRRFISFLMLSVAIMMLFNIIFAPPPKPKKPPAPAAAADADEKPVADADVAADDAKAADEPEDGAQPPPAGAQPGQLPQVAAAAVPAQLVTFGSLDPKSGYRMLVTATNTGAAVLRTEMASPRYRDQHDRTGYLGELELIDVDGGVQVQVVGPGSPAEKADIKVDDVITGVGAKKTVEIKSVEDLDAALAKTKPNQPFTLHVRRGENEPQPHVAKLAWRPFAVLRPEIENYQMRDAEPPADFVDRPSFLMTLPVVNGNPLKKSEAERVAKLLEEENWEVAASDASSVTFRRTLPELNLEVVKRYKLELVPTEKNDDINYPGYHLQMDIELKNTAQQPQTLAYRLDGPTGMPLEGWWYAHKISQRWFAAGGLRDVVVRFFNSPEVQIDCPQISEGDVEPMGQGQALAYAGVDGQYFSTVLIPQKPLEDVWFDTTEAIVVGPKPGPRDIHTFTNVTCRLSRQAIELAPGQTLSDKFTVFIGPKRPALLAQYQAGGDPNYSLKDIVYYGLALFAAVARMMLAMLHFFYGIVGNYGIAIIMLTVVVRGAMFPISYKQTKNMARMQELKPEMDRITEKYKTDMQKRSQAIQELYRKHNINPLGGCLPLILQLPVFVGLYKALMIDVELRQSPLFGHAVRWCSNLAAPDMFIDWSPIMPAFVDSGVGMLSLGPYLNILPLVTVALFLVTQKMSMPAPTNDQAAMQQKMMKYMTLMMGLFFYKVASGLCLYFIASSLWGIAERKLLPKTKTADATATGGAPGADSGSDGRRPRDNGPKSGPNGSPRSNRPRKAKRKK